MCKERHKHAHSITQARTTGVGLNLNADPMARSSLQTWLAVALSHNLAVFTAV